MNVQPGSLKRSMKVFGTLMITLSCITPASSVFIIAPGVVQQAGTGAVWSFVLAALVGVCVALVYAELSSAWPLTGGEYTIVGRALGPLSGFIVLGVNLMTGICALAAISLGIAAYIEPFFPNLNPVGIAIAAIIVSSLCGVLNIRFNAAVTGAFLFVEMLVLVCLAYFGLSHIEHPLTEFLLHPVHLGAGGMLEPASFGLIGLATSVAIYAYNGYGDAVYLGEETHEAPKNIAQVIILSLIITVITEAVPAVAVLLGAPDLKALLASPTMLTDFISQRGGRTFSEIISLGVALAIFNALIAMVLLYGRNLFSTARDHVWPRAVNNALMRIHPRFHSPWIATLVLGALSCAVCFVGENMLLVITGTSIVVVYAALCIAAIAGRRSGSTGHAVYRMRFYPLPPIIGFLALAYVLYAGYLDEAIGRPSLWATLGMVVLSAAYYLLVLRRRGGWELHGPETHLN